MLAGATYTSKISREGGRLDRLLRSGATPAAVLEEFYLAGLSRFPSAKERESLLALAGAGSKEWMEGVVWAIISSREFAHNH